MVNQAKRGAYPPGPRPLTAISDLEPASGRLTAPTGQDVNAVDIQTIPVSSLSLGDSPRLNGENPEHTRVLADSEELLPPILVHRDTMKVVDGMHRLCAARLRGQQFIMVRFFGGSTADAFVAAVKANTAHGLPLTLADRQAAAARIIASHQERSDRWIARVTGLAAATVASIRRASTDSHVVTARIGQDGRVRPLSSAEGRLVASHAIAGAPDASLREIARSAGVSPSTVRDVRKRMSRGEDPVPAGQRVARPKEEAGTQSSGGPSPATVSRGAPRDRDALLDVLKKDPSVRHTDAGRALLRWLDTTANGPGSWQHLIAPAPPHCAYTVAELARRCAREWQEVADELERRLRSMT